MVGVEIRELRPVGRGYRFRLAPLEGKYQRTSASYFNRGRKVHAVCWHGHREFFYALFQHVPDAIVITAMARYEGLVGFEDTYPSTDRNIGPPVSPIHYSECCTCDADLAALAHILIEPMHVAR